MEELRIKKIKNLNDAKNVFNFISSSFVRERIKCGEDLAPLHELYDTMLDNLTTKKDFQFYGIINKKIVAAVVSFPLPQDPKCLFISAMCVAESEGEFELANVILSEIEMFAKRKGFKKIRFRYNDLAYHYILSKGYNIFLELAIPDSFIVNGRFNAGSISFRFSKSINYNGIHFVEYGLQSADRKIQRQITSNAPLVKTAFVLEKHI